MEQPLISVICALYNGERYLDEFMASLLKQTYTNLEFILVDDYSSDQTHARLVAYAKSDQRIRVFSMPYNSLTQARKLGFDQARGKYVSFVDCDDILERDMYQLLVENVLAAKAQVSIGSSFHFIGDQIVQTMVQGQGLMPGKHLGANKRKVLTGFKAAQFHQGAIGAGINPYTAVLWDKLFARDLIAACYQQYDFKLGMGEDVALCFSALVKAQTVVATPKVVYRLRLHQKSTTQSVAYRQNLKIKRAYRYMKQCCQNTPCQAQLEAQLDYYFKYAIFTFNYRILERVRPLYPFNVKKGARVLLYGAGLFGHKLFEYEQQAGYVQVLGMVDKNKKVENTYTISDLKQLAYDYILVTIFNDQLYPDILADLTQAGVDFQKIKFIKDPFWKDFTLDEILTDED